LVEPVLHLREFLGLGRELWLLFGYGEYILQVHGHGGGHADRSQGVRLVLSASG
jgi:hypothetical protein